MTRAFGLLARQTSRSNASTPRKRLRLAALAALTALTALTALSGCLAVSLPAQQPRPARRSQPTLGARAIPVLVIDGLRFKDLDRNGTLDPYEDWRLDDAARARDLVGRMTLEEKAGAMMHGTARSGGPMAMVGVGETYDVEATGKVIRELGVNSFITRLGGPPQAFAGQQNRLQEAAEQSRLGIPVTVSTDPRHHFQYVVGASSQTGQFSQWPEPLGFAALRDPALVRHFGDIARQEYRAVGIHMTLSPQADLATEPRWSRINGTFGEDAAVATPLVKAYVEGFQHGDAGGDSVGVLAVVKHWVGYGAAKEGFDSHNAYGRLATFPGKNLAYHVRPFLGAFAAHVAGVMPTYSILEGATLGGRALEPVGAGYNRQLLTDELRGTHGFTGLIVSDWAITNDCGTRCVEGVPAGERPSFADLGMPWGVETLAKQARFAKAVQAGIDQFGGTEEAPMLVAAVRAGQVTEARLDSSVVRVMVAKLRLGLFENPFVDTAAAGRIVGSPAFARDGLDAQRRALVLLENQGSILPLRADAKAKPRRVYLDGIDSSAAVGRGWTIVTSPGDADVAIMRLSAPHQTLHPGWIFGSMQHEGDLGFREGDPAFEHFKQVSAAVPTVVTLYLDRPAILTELKSRAKAIIGNFGVSDGALLDVIAGKTRPEGRLPFELPSSMEAVRSQLSDVPHDSRAPLYPIGFGLHY